MSAATAMRLVPAAQVPRALAIFNGGNALATVIAAPLGSFLGSIIGWRGAFFCVVPVAIVVFVWQLFSLPSMKAENKAGLADVFKLLNRPVVALGMAGVSLFFMGQFSLFTYLRPFLETVTRIDVSILSLVLLMMGTAGFVGTLLIGNFLKDGLYRTVIVIPVVMAVIGVALIAFGSSFAVTSALLVLWGLLATSAPVGWWTWLSRVLPNDAEAGGGLMVAVVQLAITLGAVVGGLLFDMSGHQSTFTVSAVILLIAAFLAVLTSRQGRTAV
jgi:predicted MFS family arabinose efflux permease